MGPAHCSVGGPLSQQYTPQSFHRSVNETLGVVPYVNGRYTERASWWGVCMTCSTAYCFPNCCRLPLPGIQFRLPSSCSVDRAQPPPGTVLAAPLSPLWAPCHRSLAPLVRPLNVPKDSCRSDGPLVPHLFGPEKYNPFGPTPRCSDLLWITSTKGRKQSSPR